MTAPALDRLACEALDHYPSVRPGDRRIPLGNQGGFSGASLWRIESEAGSYCLKAWPVSSGPSPQRLASIHSLMNAARVSGLAFVPSVFTTHRGATWVELAGRLWDLTTWMPGRAAFHDRPTRPRLEAACVALAQLHTAWHNYNPSVGLCPAVQRRLQSVSEWSQLVASGWRPRFDAGFADPLRPWAERAWQLLGAWADWVPGVLAPWAGRPLSLQPCVCDVWHDHVLFEGDRVSGLIDYGSTKIDHPAVDLARLLGNLVGDDEPFQTLGLCAYRRLRQLSGEDEILVNLLDRTGIVVGITHWLRWVYYDGRAFDHRQLAAARLRALVQRVARWEGASD
jgi:homoserine kinase type II